MAVNYMYDVNNAWCNGGFSQKEYGGWYRFTQKLERSIKLDEHCEKIDLSSGIEQIYTNGFREYLRKQPKTFLVELAVAFDRFFQNMNINREELSDNPIYSAKEVFDRRVGKIFYPGVSWHKKCVMIVAVCSGENLGCVRVAEVDFSGIKFGREAIFHASRVFPLAELDERNPDSHYEEILKAKDLEILRLKKELATNKSDATSNENVPSSIPMDTGSPHTSLSRNPPYDSLESDDDSQKRCTPSSCTCTNHDIPAESPNSSSDSDTPQDMPVLSKIPTPKSKIVAGIPKYRRPRIPSPEVAPDSAAVVTNRCRVGSAYHPRANSPTTNSPSPSQASTCSETYSCSDCAFSTSTKRNLYSHRTYAHKEKVPCKWCNNLYRSKYLKTHEPKCPMKNC